MDEISRRQFLYFSALSSCFYYISDLRSFAVADDNTNFNDIRYPLTLTLLKEAYWAEMIAFRHYDGYIQKALSEKYFNIAYLFSALSSSEQIHANNYKALITSLGATIKNREINVSIKNTKKNLNTASIKELEKINEFYPEILRKLSAESHDQSVVNCMYSWKSHQQHAEIIADIKRYSGLFFDTLAKKIEGMDPNYYVCDLCGSTVDEKPEIPCEICNYPVSHYQKLNRPLQKK